jgi:hypothetical protein
MKPRQKNNLISFTKLRVMKQHLHSFIVITSLLLTTTGQKAIAQFTSNGLTTAPQSNLTSERKRNTDENWQAAAMLYIEKSDYFFKAFDGNFAFANKKQQLSFSTTGLSLTTNPIGKGEGRSNWKSSILLTGIS